MANKVPNLYSIGTTGSAYRDGPSLASSAMKRELSRVSQKGHILTQPRLSMVNAESPMVQAGLSMLEVGSPVVEAKPPVGYRISKIFRDISKI